LRYHTGACQGAKNGSKGQGIVGYGSSTLQKDGCFPQSSSRDQGETREREQAAETFAQAAKGKSRRKMGDG
jgi:hypothetical protein